MNYPHVYDEAETMAAAVAGRSIARFGDGELKLAMGRDAKSQRFDGDLKKMLRLVLMDPGGPCLPCIPREIPDGPKAHFWRPYTFTPYTLLYRPDGVYGSAFITRPDSAPGINRRPHWEAMWSLWRDRDVVLVRGSGKSFTRDSLTGANSVHEIISARQHAWEFRMPLFQTLRREKRPVILCLGATATVLAWELAQEGVHAIDLGHAGMFARKIGSDGRVPDALLDAKE